MRTQFMRYPFSALLLVLLACGQQTETRSLGDPCTSDGQCDAGQACLLTREEPVESSLLRYAGDTTESNGATEQTCQIPCFRDAECPSGFRCDGDAVASEELEDGSAICVSLEQENEDDA